MNELERLICEFIVDMSMTDLILELRDNETIVELATEANTDGSVAQKAIVKVDWNKMGVRYNLVSKFGSDDQKIHISSKKLFLIKRRFDKLEFYDC